MQEGAAAPQTHRRNVRRHCGDVMVTPTTPQNRHGNVTVAFHRAGTTFQVPTKDLRRASQGPVKGLVPQPASDNEGWFAFGSNGGWTNLRQREQMNFYPTLPDAAGRKRKTTAANGE